jgi:hypothetical protein
VPRGDLHLPERYTRIEDGHDELGPEHVWVHDFVRNSRPQLRPP